MIKIEHRNKKRKINDKVCYDDADLVVVLVLVAALFESLWPTSATAATAATAPASDCTETVDPAGEYPTTPATATAAAAPPTTGDRGARRTLGTLPPPDKYNDNDDDSPYTRSTRRGDHPANPVQSRGRRRCSILHNARDRRSQ